MQTTKDCEQLNRSHEYETVSPCALLAGCAIGLCTLVVAAVAGVSVDKEAPQLVDRIQAEHARLALSHSAAEHQRAVFVSRQERHDKRVVVAVHASTTVVAPGLR